MPSSLNYNFFCTHIYRYIRTDPITLPCSFARAGNKLEWPEYGRFYCSFYHSRYILLGKCCP